MDGWKEGERLEQPLKTINKIFSSSSSPLPTSHTLFLPLFAATEKVEHGTVQGIESRGSLRLSMRWRLHGRRLLRRQIGIGSKMMAAAVRQKEKQGGREGGREVGGTDG